MGKTLVVVGILIAGLGVLTMAGLPLGRLPGDLVFRRGNTSIYVPLATCVLMSVALTFLIIIFRR